MAKQMIQMPRKPRSWFGIAVTAVLGIIAIKAFWPAADAKLGEAATSVKKVVNPDKTTTP